MPWENTEQYIRSGHRDAEEFQKDTLKTITLNEKEGIKAVVGKPKGKHTMEVVSYLFEKGKGWTLEKAKEWFLKHHNPAKEHVYAVLPFTITEKIMEKPLRIRGVAMTAGMSRNFNIYTPDELQAFAGKLVEAPVYIEHVTTANSVGKVAKTAWDGQHLWYEAEIYDDETAEKIRKGLIRDEELWSDAECTSRAKALLASLKDSAEQLTLRSTVVDYGTTPLLPGDKVHVALPNEGVDGDFRILSAEYYVDGKTQTLETLLELGREQPLLADYMFSLKSKTDSLSRYKLARV
jgi:hypothetical protein